MTVSPDETAHDVLEVVPLVMATIRTAMRSHRASDISIPQFRTLSYLNRHPGASLGDVSDHIGLTLSSVSKFVDDLVERSLVTRAADPTDRRYITLEVTPEGKAMLDSMRQATQGDLVEILVNLSEAEQATVIEAMQALRRVFTNTERR